MTWQMTRIRMRGIGDPAARFRDLTLPLADSHGLPVDTLLWLRNGGGKTSLLSLLFAHVLPFRVDFMGNASQDRTLEEYIQGGDTAHVAVEWIDVEGGFPGLPADAQPRLITGMVHEWANRVAPADRDADKRRLNSVYYSLTPVSGVLGLDTLPMRGDDGKAATLREFVEALREANRQAQAALSLETFDDLKGKWADHLDEVLGIDPGLYRYQVRMNAAEGAVAQMFRFRSSREFVDFLIDFTAAQSGTAASTLEETSNTTGTLLKSLAERPRHTVEQVFSTAAASRLTALHVAGSGRAAARSDLASAKENAGVLASTITAAIGDHQSAGELVTARWTTLREQANTLEPRHRKALKEAATYDLIDAELAAVQAREEARAAEREAEDAVRTDRAWHLVPHLRDLDDVTGRISALRATVEAEAAHTRPLAEAHDRAARALHAALGQAVRSTLSYERALAERIEKLKADSTTHRRKRDEALRRAAALTSEAKAAREEAQRRSAQARTEQDAPEVRPFLPVPTTETQTAVAAQRKASAAAARQEAVIAQLAERDRELRDRLGELSRMLVPLREQGEEAERMASAAASAARRARNALADVAGQPQLRDLAETTEDLDVHALGPGMLVRLADNASAMLAEYAAQAATATAHDAVLAAIVATGFAPAAGEAIDACARLRRAGFDARPGWEALRGLQPDPGLLAASLRDDRLAVLAAGAVVPPEQLAEVTRLLAQGQVTTAGVVAVSDQAALSTALTASPEAFLPGRVPVDPALLDAAAAVETQAERQHAAGQARSAAQQAREEAERDTSLRGRLEAVLADYPARELQRLNAEEGTTRQRAEGLSGRIKEITAEQEDLTTKLGRLAEERDTASQALTAAASAAQALARAMGQ